MKLVITGALGYIGARLMRMPWHHAFDEILLIDKPDGLSPHNSERDRAQFDPRLDGRGRFVEGDIRTFDLAASLDRGDVVVHLAAMTGAEATLGDPRVVDAVNVDGALRVAEACADRGAKLVFLSSTSVYGGIDGAVDEATPLDACPPDNPYASSKLRAERLIRALAGEVPLAFVIARCGTIYGPSEGMRFHTAVSRFCWQATVGEPLTVWRTAMEQRRPYLDLEDAVRAIQFLIAQDRFDGRTFNVVTETATVREVIAHIAAHIEDVRVEVVDSAIMTPRSQVVSRVRIEREGFVFHGSLDDGIRRTVAVLNGVRESQLLHEPR
jgi:UDP-glucose 4-epimerase